MTVINWPHGPETMQQHLTRFSQYVYRKRMPNSPCLSAMMYGVYLHFKTETGTVINFYEDLNRPLKNKIHHLAIGQLLNAASVLIERVQTDLNIVVEK